jgi:hypothetical protein
MNRTNVSAFRARKWREDDGEAKAPTAIVQRAWFRPATMWESAFVKAIT